jgi:hypothetical protein
MKSSAVVGCPLRKARACSYEFTAARLQYQSKMFNMLKRGVRTIFGNAKNFAAFAVSSYDFEVLAHLRLMPRCVLQPRLEAANDMGIV